MAVAMVDATQCTLKQYNLLPGEKNWIKRVLEGYKFSYYGDEDHKFVIKVKSPEPYKLKMTCAEMIDSLNKEVDKSDQLIVKTGMTNLETGEPFTNEKTMIELTKDISKRLQYAGVEIYLHSECGNFTHFKVEDKAKIAAPPKTKTADSPFRPRRKLSKRDKKSSFKSAQKRRKSKNKSKNKHSPKPRSR